MVMGQSLNILAVDDETSVAHALALVLGSPARKLTIAFDGEEALAIIGTHTPSFDIIITDHKMPRLSGLELVQRLRAQNFRGKIVVLSAYLTEDNRRAYAELNVDRMLGKPFSVRELCEVIDSLAKAA